MAPTRVPAAVLLSWVRFSIQCKRYSYRIYNLLSCGSVLYFHCPKVSFQQRRKCPSSRRGHGPRSTAIMWYSTRIMQRGCQRIKSPGQKEERVGWFDCGASVQEWEKTKSTFYALRYIFYSRRDVLIRPHSSG